MSCVVHSCLHRIPEISFTVNASTDYSIFSIDVIISWTTTFLSKDLPMRSINIGDHSSLYSEDDKLLIPYLNASIEFIIYELFASRS